MEPWGRGRLDDSSVRRPQRRSIGDVESAKRTDSLDRVRNRAKERRRKLTEKLPGRSCSSERSGKRRKYPSVPVESAMGSTHQHQLLQKQFARQPPEPVSASPVVKARRRSPSVSPPRSPSPKPVRASPSPDSHRRQVQNRAPSRSFSGSRSRSSTPPKDTRRGGRGGRGGRDRDTYSYRERDNLRGKERERQREREEKGPRAVKYEPVPDPKPELEPEIDRGNRESAFEGIDRADNGLYIIAIVGLTDITMDTKASEDVRSECTSKCREALAGIRVEHLWWGDVKGVLEGSYPSSVFVEVEGRSAAVKAHSALCEKAHRREPHRAFVRIVPQNHVKHVKPKTFSEPPLMGTVPVAQSQGSKFNMGDLSKDLYGDDSSDEEESESGSE